ncbi:WecB/TagA/CpsF family glycosyltransferase [Bosea sp. LjRoot9]|uniref:WecB/TagA/CpsF family glycosyltransferase n=1 Tax=Bosea sp. LjRoot9 TaxID=3342341 RepID=UPI003ED09C00
MVAALSLNLATQADAPAKPGFATRDIGGIGIAVLTRPAALAEVDDAIANQRHLKLAFCNANLVNLAAHDQVLRRDLAGFLVLADGIGVDLGGWLLHGAGFPANLNGTDFIPGLLATGKRRLRVALLGGRPGIAARASVRLSLQYPEHRFSVLSHGYFAPEEEPALLAKLEATPPDLLLVAFGNPRQERWISQRLGPQHCLVAAGVGALFDFLAGEVPRAPEAFRQLRLEWLFRLWLEPSRLWRRYVFGNPVFVLRMLRTRLFERRPTR